MRAIEHLTLHPVPSTGLTFSADGKTAALQMTNVSPSLTSRAGPRWTAESTPAFMDFRLVFKPIDDPGRVRRPDAAVPI